MTAVLSRALVSQPNLANSRWYPPHLFTHLIPSHATDGAAGLIHFTGLAGGEPPLHVHSLEDEFVYLLRGDAVYEAGGVQMSARAGSFVWLPRDVEHGFEFYSTVGKGLLGFVPGNYERWFLEFSRPAEFMTLPPDEDAALMINIERMIHRGNELGVDILPQRAVATKPNPLSTTKPFATNVSGVEPLEFPGYTLRYLARSAQTGGALTVFENVVDTSVSIPLHAKAQLEIAYVIRGQVRFQLGDTLVESAAGAAVMAPAGMSFGYRNIGPDRCSVLHMIVGGTFDKFSHELLSLDVAGTGGFMGIRELMKKHGMVAYAPEIAD